MFVRFSKRLLNVTQDKFSRKIGASGKRYRPRYICTIKHLCKLYLSLCCCCFIETYVKRDFCTLLLDLDPCLDVTCDYHCLCKAFGPYDARCVHAENCPSYQEPICSSNGTTFDNRCLFEQEMCLLRLNYTVQHPGGCEG